ncbi:putative fad dependent oxidoreductase [Podospora conica]|nr:putative fad dependent oxidoreductase [Schizothecium conicum]
MASPPSPSLGPVQATDTAAHRPCGLPVPNPSRSFWHSEPSATLLGHRTTEELPETADVVVVGSGITGAFAAWFLKNGVGGGEKGESVVMLEAREACWGATGRNGGHIQPFLYASPPSPARFELANYSFLRAFVAHHNVPCDWTDLVGVHGFLTPALWTAVERAVLGLKRRKDTEYMADGAVELISSPTRLGELGVPGACGAVVQRFAGSLWPYKLVVWVLEGLLAAEGKGGGFNLQTGTPVLSIQRREDGGGGWAVTTPRGTVHARKVLLATNAWTAYLVPGMEGLVVPVRGQVGGLVPPGVSPGGAGTTTDADTATGTAEEEEGRLDISTKHSYCFFADQDGPAPRRDEYLVQRPGGGYLIFGGARSLARDRGIGEWRDDEVEGDVAAFLRGRLIPPLQFPPSDPSSGTTTTAAAASDDTTPDDTAPQQHHQHHQTATDLQAAYEWTGIMGYSRDGHPWVGSVPASLGGGDGLFVAAAFSGHGMPNAVLSAHAAVRAIRGGELRDGGAGEVDGVRYTLPAEFVLTEERVERAQKGETLAERDLGGWGAEFAMLGVGGP